MSIWNSVLFILSFSPLLVTIYFISNLIAQGRKSWKKINYWVITLAFIAFAHSCWQISFFYDERYYLILPFPQDYFSHVYLFLTPMLLACLAIPKMYANISKILYTCLFLSVVLAVLALFAYPGKDLVWFSISLSVLLIFIGLKEEQFGLYYKHYLKFLFLENTWVALYYFKNENLFLLGLILQTIARIYFFNFLKLFWIQGFLKKNYENKQTVNQPVGGLLKE